MLKKLIRCYLALTLEITGRYKQHLYDLGDCQTFKKLPIQIYIRKILKLLKEIYSILKSQIQEIS